MMCVHKRGIVKEGQNLGLVPCGKCIPCRVNKRREWAIRMSHESLYHPHSLFFTLTYDDENVRGYTDERNRQNFWNFRQWFRRRGERPRYVAVREYGPRTGRPHMHGILWTQRCYSDSDVQEAWHKGFTMSAPVTAARMNYLNKYVAKGQIGSKIYVSCRPGIGGMYANFIQRAIMDGDWIIGVDGRLAPMPRYYRKLYGNSPENLSYRSESDFNYKRLPNRGRLLQQQEVARGFVNGGKF